MSRRGFFAVGIWHPKKTVNVGTLMRSAHCFGADFTFSVGGARDALRQASNTTKSERHIPHFEYRDLADLMEHLPLGCRLVGVEQVGGATALEYFDHPESAAYLLGAEDAGLPREVISACHEVVEITHCRFCLNVAVAGSIVIHHRILQNGLAKPDP